MLNLSETGITMKRKTILDVFSITIFGNFRKKARKILKKNRKIYKIYGTC
jgi:hypothetical protein